ncbi:interleukin-6 receptor subunit alpha, partial [Phasianus colchicus]
MELKGDTSEKLWGTDRWGTPGGAPSDIAPPPHCSPALPQDTVLGRPGANVTLLCRDPEPPNGTVLWSGRRRALGGGNALLLGGLRPEDAGRYSCHQGGHTLRTVRLLVEEPPEPPHVSCSRRSHDKDVLCEWQPRALPAPGTRAVLWMKRRFTAENMTEQRCHFYSVAQKFVCRVKVPPGTEDTKALVVSVCVSSRAGSSTGEDRIITLNGILKPDPPLNVSVEAVEFSPQRLRVRWSYPPSWDPRFYWLRFQVRYRPEPTPTFTQVDQVTRLWMDIGDAWRGTRHVVQVRAQEEFGHGAWSEWSREAVGTPWTEPRDVTEMGPYSSQFPAEDDPYGYGVTLPPELFSDDTTDDTRGAVLEATARSPTSPYALLVAGGSLLLAIALCFAIGMRYKQRAQAQRGAKLGGGGQHPMVPLCPPGSPLSSTPLLPPAAPPGPLHVTNLDY